MFSFRNDNTLRQERLNYKMGGNKKGQVKAGKKGKRTVLH